MTETVQKKTDTGTTWIVFGVIFAAIGLIQLVNAPLSAASGNMAGMAGNLFGLVLFGGLGVWWLIRGIGKHRASR